MFYGLVKVATNSEDKILVLDESNCRILKFDKLGYYLQTIGRKGQGPGEFENPIRIVSDSEGKYIAKIPLKSKTHVIIKNKLYTIEEDEQGYQVVKRYRITWKI